MSGTMEAKRFIPGAGAHLTREQATRYGCEIEAITARSRDGITPSDVLEEAKNSSSPLHNYFEWDDRKAAQRWRIEQAKYLLRHIDVIVELEDRPEEKIITRAWQCPENGSGYQATKRIMESVDARSLLLEQALRELEWFKTKYAILQELSGIFTAFDMLAVKSTKRASRIQKRPSSIRQEAHA